LKIAIPTDAWPPHMCGISHTLVRITDMLKERGHEVLVLYPEMFGNVPCPTYTEIKLAVLPGRAVAKKLDEFAPDAVHIPVEGPIGYAARSWCLKRGYPFTTSFTTKFPEYIRKRTGLPEGPMYTMYRKFHGKAARTMVATPSLKAELEGIGFKNLVFWGRGVDADLFRPRDKSFLDLPRPIAVYMGRVAVEKNIEAFLDLDLPGSKLVVGDGPAMDKLMKKYPNAVFVGRKSGEELAKHLAASDVFVFPSLTDTFGIVMIEAMACGLPVAAYPTVGPKDLVVDGVTGKLSDDLKTAVEGALKMDPAACREHALHYTWERSLEQFLDNLEPIRR
jgi:glycosyltransferase involved in cell wall biosynthesis